LDCEQFDEILNDFFDDIRNYPRTNEETTEEANKRFNEFWQGNKEKLIKFILETKEINHCLLFSNQFN
jgi:hypothetical protein